MIRMQKIKNHNSHIVVNGVKLNAWVSVDYPWVTISENGMVTAYVSKPVHFVRACTPFDGEWDLGDDGWEWQDVGQLRTEECEKLTVPNWKECIFKVDAENPIPTFTVDMHYD